MLPGVSEMPTCLPTPGTAGHDEVWAIGLDVGGTKIAGGLGRFPAGDLTSREIIPTHPGRDPAAILADVAALAHRLFVQVPSGEPYAGVGIGVPELVDLQGQVASGQTIDWRGISLAELLAGIGGVYVEADVRAAALAEARLGAGRPYRLFAYVTVGTGISSTLVQDGRPHAGARGNALVLGSSPMSFVCPQCDSLVAPVLEEIASGPALVRRYNQIRPGRAARGEEVLALARQDDADASCTRQGQCCGFPGQRARP